ncbi:MAG: hypothetical protein RL708_1787 [Bacteroidota bacterium]|jgi:hypothetical protein
MNYLLETKSHLHPRQPHTWLGYRRGRAGNVGNYSGKKEER